MRDYHKLQVWNRAHLLTLQVYRHTTRFPRDERFGLVAQMRRAAASVPTNIVEGTGRPTPGDFARFLGIAAASLHELQYHLELARDLGYGDPGEGDAMRREAAEIRAMITALRSKVGAGSG
jgi:four helix bundle protein